MPFLSVTYIYVKLNILISLFTILIAVAKAQILRINMSDAWFSNKLAPDGDVEDACHPDEAEALKKCLR